MIIFYTDDPDDAMRSAALANQGRLLCTLSQGEHCVSALDRAWHARREGKQVLYRIASVEALALLQLLYHLYCPTPLESRND